MPYSTDIYKLDDAGNISFLASYSQPKEKALKCAVLQLLRKDYATWDYEKREVKMRQSKITGQFMYFYGDNSVLFTRNERITEEVKPVFELWIKTANSEQEDAYVCDSIEACVERFIEYKEFWDNRQIAFREKPYRFSASIERDDEEIVSSKEFRKLLKRRLAEKQAQSFSA